MSRKLDDSLTQPLIHSPRLKAAVLGKERVEKIETTKRLNEALYATLCAVSFW
jgi:hypothetical protein